MYNDLVKNTPFYLLFYPQRFYFMNLSLYHDVDDNNMYLVYIITYLMYVYCVLRWYIITRHVFIQP